MRKSQSEKNKAFQSFSWLVLDKVVTLGGAAVISIAIARHLGPYDFGLLNYVIALASLVAAVGGLGLNGLVTRDLVYQPEAEAKIFGTISIMTTIATALVSVAVAIWALLAGSIDHRITWLLILVISMGVFKRFEFLESWFVVHGKVRSYATARILVVLVFIAIRVVLLVLGASLQAFLVVLAIETALSGIRSLAAYRLVSGAKPKWKWDKETARDSLKRSWPVLLSGITAFIYLRVDVMMLTWWVSPQEAGIYAAAARLSEVWYFMPQLFMSAVFPALLKMRQSSLSEYNRRLQDVLDVMAAAGFMVAVGVSLTAWWVIPFLYGSDYSPAAQMLTVHVWAGVFVFMRAVLSKWLIAEELYIYSLVTHGAGALINVALNVVLIPLYGGKGAAVATLVSYATAGFLSLSLSSKTRRMFVMMSKSLLWPRRIREAIAYVVELGHRRRGV